MTMSSSGLELNTYLTLAVTADLCVSVPTQFSYVHTDPYAVQVCFHVTPAWKVRWTFARELLDQGMKAAVGHGDVRIAPVEPSMGEYFSIELDSPYGHARLEGHAPPVEAWIATTYEAVPAGSETALLDLDRFFEEHSGR